MNWFLKLCVLTSLIYLNVAVYVIPETVITQIGGSYTVMLVDEDDTIKPKECYLSNRTISYEIDLTTSGILLKPNNTIPPVEETNIKTSLGYGICGFKLDNVGNNPIKWNISFVDENENFYYQTVDAFLRDEPSENKTTYVTVGDSFHISCGEYLESQYLLNCELYNPQGTLVISSDSKRNTCQHESESSKMSDYGGWKCVLQFEYNMTPKNIYYNILEKENVIINTWQNETDTHVNIGCSIKNIDIYEDNFCKMIRSDGEIFTLKEGLATDRYTALSTNISNKICGMEIKKPLEEFDRGLWRCEFHARTYKPIGGFINLSNDSSSLPPPEIPKQIITHISENFSVSCKVPFSSSYCYMLGPSGTIYPVEDNFEPSIGLCRFEKKDASFLDNGTWSCGFSKKTGEPDAVYSFEVQVLENNTITPEKKIVESVVGNAVHLKCSTEGLGDYSLQYCRFKSPKGEFYNINPEETSDRINYYGRGLKFGDCGIELKDIQLIDDGTWTCITRIGYGFKYSEVYGQIYLSVR